MMGFGQYKKCDTCEVQFLAVPGQWKCSDCLAKARQRKTWAQRRTRAAQRTQRAPTPAQPGWAAQRSRIVPLVTIYWMCGACAGYWHRLVQAERGPTTLADEYAGYPAEIDLIVS